MHILDLGLNCHPVMARIQGARGEIFDTELRLFYSWVNFGQGDSFLKHGCHQEEDAGHETGEGQRHGHSGYL